MVLPKEKRAGGSMNNFRGLIQFEKTTDKRLVMAPHHNEICSEQTCDARHLLSRVTGSEERLAFRIVCPHSIYETGQTPFSIFPVLLEQPVHIFCAKFSRGGRRINMDHFERHSELPGDRDSASHPPLRVRGQVNRHKNCPKIKSRFL